MLQPQERLKSELTPSSTPESVKWETQICRNATSLAAVLTAVLVKLFTTLHSSSGWRQHREHPTSTSVLPAKRLFHISWSRVQKPAKKAKRKVCQHMTTRGQWGGAGADVPTGCYTDSARDAERASPLVCSDAKSRPLMLPAAAAGAARSALLSRCSPWRVSLCKSSPFTTPQYASCTHKRTAPSLCPRKASLLRSPFLTKSLSVSFLALAHQLPMLILAYSSTYSLVHHVPVSSHFLPFLFCQPFSDTPHYIPRCQAVHLMVFFPWKNQYFFF